MYSYFKKRIFLLFDIIKYNIKLKGYFCHHILFNIKVTKCCIWRMLKLNYISNLFLQVLLQ